MYKIILKKLMSSPITVFVYSILSKWMIVIFVTTLIVTYWVFKGLHDSGILLSAEQVVVKALNDTKSVAKFCIPQILDFGYFWHCLQNPPEYKPSSEEINLENQVKGFFNSRPQSPSYGSSGGIHSSSENPYE